jgi:YD repeat-containing protein
MKFLTFSLLTTHLIANLAHGEVNMKTGSYYKTWIDVEIIQDKYSFQLRRTYDSRSLHPGIFGYGWCSDFEKSLEFRREGEIVLRDCRLKSDIRYQKIKPTLYRSRDNPQETLEFTNDTYLRQTTSSLQKFNSLGQFVSLSNHHGFHLQLQYGPSGSLHKITLPHFAEVVFQMDARSRHVQSLRTVGSPLIIYKYDGLDLTSATNAWRGTFNYQYDDVHNLTQVTYPDLTSEELTYDKERDWILHIRTRDQCQENFRWTLTGARAPGKYQSTAQRTCRGRLVSQSQFSFDRKAKLKTSARKISAAQKINLGGLDESN